ncbi:tryptophan-rich sensory protein [Mongoliitalea daihaiensis]|uniref:tryptophan-rich sensory protein n=1 Tax=Mongoliitalea daihaiensis TaxID=2782006 RepID=UPI001F413B86|nr:tryptophan-rich sensory protein [Mongoliitalea daihaiensis]UJP65414.1 tryptophan-rich sensory protein [Mongoliitalea daihaiensis]
MKNQLFLLANLLSFGITIFMNYLFSTGFDGKKSVGEISAIYSVDITPAGFTFAIWGLIYLGLTILCIQLILEAIRSKDPNLSKKLGPWFILSNGFNAAWIYFWTSEMIFVSVLIIIALLICLIILTVRTTSLDTSSFFSFNYFSQTSLRIYTGWVIAATVLNVSIWISALDLEFLDYPFVSVGVLLVAATIYILVGLKFKSSTIPLVGSWAFWGIGSNSPDVPLISLVALVVSGIFVAVSVAILAMTKKRINS